MSRDLVGPDASGRVAAECRCWALLKLGRADACVTALDEILAQDEASTWVPHPALVRMVINKRAGEGRGVEASLLAAVAAASHPNDPRVLELEIAVRSQIEGEQEVLASIEARLDVADVSLAQRIALAKAHSDRLSTDAALRVLGDELPPSEDPLALMWFEERARALALAGDVAALRGLFERWQAWGGEPVDLQARYALRIDTAQLADPVHSSRELLARAVANQAQLSDPRLRWAVYRRLIGLLVEAGETEEALALYDEGRQLVAFPQLSRRDIERSALSRALAAGEPAGPPGKLAFSLVSSEQYRGTLLVSPDVTSEPDTPYESFAIKSGTPLEVERSPGITPQRWVFRDRAGQIRASGTVWPRPDERSVVEIAPNPAQRVVTREIAGPANPADGRRRVFTIILDCSDWRLVEYLRARGELPLHDHLLARGRRAVLESAPAFTAAAMESLVWPMRGREISFVGLVQRMGLELGGLSSVGKNPLDFLSVILPESESLFQVLGAGDRVAANLLFSHGGIDAGRHAQMLGPEGLERKVELDPASRAITHVEHRDFPRLPSGGRDGRHIETIAAEFDSAIEIARAGEVDLLMLRIESLDLLTHAFFGELLQEGQDDGTSPLLASYRYIDARLAALYRELDRDDYLIVMSDHGIRTPMEHESDAFFVLVGQGVPQGRASGRPHLRGVPRLLAALQGVDTEWPSSGLEALVEPESEPLRSATAQDRATQSTSRL